MSISEWNVHLLWILVLPCQGWDAASAPIPRDWLIGKFGIQNTAQHRRDVGKPWQVSLLGQNYGLLGCFLLMNWWCTSKCPYKSQPCCIPKKRPWAVVLMKGLIQLKRAIRSAEAFPSPLDLWRDQLRPPSSVSGSGEEEGPAGLNRVIDPLFKQRITSTTLGSQVSISMVKGHWVHFYWRCGNKRTQVISLEAPLGPEELCRLSGLGFV